MEEPELLTNSARRLHAILLRSKPYNNVSSRSALAKTFGVDELDHATIYGKFAALLRLAQIVETRFRALPHKHSAHYIKAVESVKGAMRSVNMDTHWNNYIGKVSESDLALLSLAGDFLDSFREEALIDRSVLTLNDGIL